VFNKRRERRLPRRSPEGEGGLVSRSYPRADAAKIALAVADIDLIRFRLSWTLPPFRVREIHCVFREQKIRSCTSMLQQWNCSSFFFNFIYPSWSPRDWVNWMTRCCGPWHAC